MAEHYRGIIADALEEYDKSTGNPTGNADVYKALTWAALKGTISWDELSESEKTAIENNVKKFDNDEKNYK